MRAPGLREPDSAGLAQTAWTALFALRIRRLGVRVPPSAPTEHQVSMIVTLYLAYPRRHLAAFWAASPFVTAWLSRSA